MSNRDRFELTKTGDIYMNNYPFAEELVTDTNGKISKVIIKFDDYRHILEMLEDQALYQAMKETEGETPLSREEALRELED